LKNNTGKIFVISGPSGVGKSTIVKDVLQRTGAAFGVSATTRPRRKGETDGKDYCFVDKRQFEQLVAQGQMLEWAEVFPGRFYGTPVAQITEAIDHGRKIVLDIDVQGAIQVHAKLPHATFILIEPPSQEILKGRLVGRGSETPDEVACRLDKALAELKAARNSGIYTYTVVNDDLSKAVDRVVEIINQESVNK
jgi:guanylate kinase